MGLALRLVFSSFAILTMVKSTFLGNTAHCMKCAFMNLLIPLPTSCPTDVDSAVFKRESRSGLLMQTQVFRHDPISGYLARSRIVSIAR